MSIKGAGESISILNNSNNSNLISGKCRLIILSIIAAAIHLNAHQPDTLTSQQLIAVKRYTTGCQLLTTSQSMAVPVCSVKKRQGCGLFKGIVSTTGKSGRTLSYGFTGCVRFFVTFYYILAAD